MEMGLEPQHWGDFAEVLVAEIMAARYGWAIVMPDYQGMGYDTSESHPYCIREKLAVATADMLEVGISTLKSGKYNNLSWDGNAFVFGYSEGDMLLWPLPVNLKKEMLI